VRQLAHAAADVTLAGSYEPFGTTLSTGGTSDSIFRFAGEQTDSSGILYMRARYYASYLNQWIQPDPIVADPFVPADWNLYTYVRNNPINLVDPSGLRVCSGSICPDSVENYNLTGWLIRAMNANASSADVENIRTFVDLAGPVIPDALWAVIETLWEKHSLDLQCIYSKIREDPYRAQAYSSWESLVRFGARWDFKTQIDDEMGDNIRLCASENACRWYDSDVVGNIHFGYVGRAAGFRPIELHMGAGKAHQEGDDPGSGRFWWYGDDPLDGMAIRLGIKLYHGPGLVTAESFRAVLFEYQFNLRRGERPLRLVYVAPFPVDAGLGPRFPVTYFDGGKH